MNQKNITKPLFLTLFVLVILLVGFIVIFKTSKTSSQENKVTNTTLSKTNTNSSITSSKKKAGAVEEQQYIIKPNGERCALVDLDDFEPTRNTSTKTYEWIIKFPPDDCVIQEPPTNLPEKIGDLKSENIQGTDFRKIVVSYQ